MSAVNAAVEKQLAVLRVRFVRGLPDRMTAIADAIANEGPTREIERLFHSLAGTAATYRMPEVASMAREGEELCGEPLDDARRARAGEIARELQTVIMGLVEREGFVAQVQVGSFATHRMTEGAVDRIVLVARADPSNEALRRRLTQEGFGVVFVSTLLEARAVLALRTPAVVIAAVDLPDGHASDVIAALRGTTGGNAAVAFVLGTPRTFVERIRMLHCGADGSFADVGDIDTIVQTVCAAQATAPVASPRVLCVEDDPEYVAWVRAVLTGAGYEFMAVADPARFEATLASFQPDLLLLDIVLPEVSGVELARYVRHMPSLAMLPIIFLSGTDAQRIDGLRAGGDDYLLKPVSPELLLTTVATRLKRSRVVQTLIDRDGLTGLLTHSAFARRMRIGLADARRTRDAFAIVMLDIDRFKSINDRYGHLIGDRVLASFGAFLRRSVRASDIAARYGGEEFALLLRGLDRAGAQELVQRLLEQFEAIDHRAGDGTSFRVTFSAGVAVLDTSVDVDLSVGRADAALYAAKEAGRARVKAAA